MPIEMKPLLMFTLIAIARLFNWIAGQIKIDTDARRTAAWSWRVWQW